MCAEVFLVKMQPRKTTLLKQETPARVFSCDVYEILRIPFLQKTFVRLLLLMVGVN